eukprot:1150529-Pelagomonas_calceolata.AAC.7
MHLSPSVEGGIFSQPSPCRKISSIPASLPTSSTPKQHSRARQQHFPAWQDKLALSSTCSSSCKHGRASQHSAALLQRSSSTCEHGRDSRHLAAVAAWQQHLRARWAIQHLAALAACQQHLRAWRASQHSLCASSEQPAV